MSLDLSATIQGTDVEPARAPSMLRALVKSWEARGGLALGGVMLAIIFLGPVVAAYDPTQLGTGPPVATPSASHPLGTDNLGRDVLSRFLNGGHTVLIIPVAAVTLAILIGALPGMLGGYLGGRTDALITRLFDVLLTLPPLLVVLVVVGGAGTASWVLVITIGVIYAPRIGRIARGATQGVGRSDYVLAAQARGERTLAILLREIAPNVAGPLLADTALRLTYAVIFIATLSFLGLGAQPPSSDWGLSVATARAFLPVQPWATLVPAVGIAALSVSFNLIADAMARHLARDSHRGLMVR